MISPPPQPPLQVFYGITFYIIYIIWTICFDLFNLTCEGLPYIYKSLSWSTHPFLSLTIVCSLLGVYTGVYFITRRVLIGGCDPRGSTSSQRVTRIPSLEEDRSEGALKLRQSSHDSLEDVPGLNHPTFVVI
jgi:hypothetical protein